jgi:type VII secretion-associated serine protease mycosin
VADANGGGPAGPPPRAGRAWGVALAVSCVASLTLVVAPAGPAAAADQCVTPGPAITPILWAQQMLAPERAWSFTQGLGQTVAVLDSGVDGGQPQLRGHVAPGYDAVSASGSANTDCAGTGTGVAGAVAAQKPSSPGVYGVAPGVTIVPVRVRGEPGADTTAPVSPDVLARGINWAVDHQADVLDISVALSTDAPQVRQAVAGALAAGVTVVAAVGDSGGSGDGDPATYPASYPGVIGVGAIGQGGLWWPNSEYGDYVDLVAPGAGLPVLQRGSGLLNVDGSTALAAGFVSGAAALARARWPRLTGQQLTDRLLATATPPAGGQDGPEYGHGIVNPYGVVSNDMVSTPPVPMSVFTPPGPSREQLDRAAAWDHGRRTALALTMVGLGLLLVVVLVGVGVPRARRRAWRPALAAPVHQPVEPDEPPPPTLLFEEPAPGSGAMRR